METSERAAALAAFEKAASTLRELLDTETSPIADSTASAAISDERAELLEVFAAAPRLAAAVCAEVR